MLFFGDVMICLFPDEFHLGDAVMHEDEAELFIDGLAVLGGVEPDAVRAGRFDKGEHVLQDARGEAVFAPGGGGCTCLR